MKKITLLVILLLSGILTLNAQSKGEIEKRLLVLDPNLPGETARIFAPGKVSTPMQDWGISISSDFKEIFYTVTCIKGKGNAKLAIVSIKWENGKWTDPEVVPFSGKEFDSCPQISKDGKRIIFLSRRATAPGDTLKDSNIWCVEKKGKEWGAPYPINEINTEFSENFPSLAANGDLYFCANYAGKGKSPHIHHSKYVNGKYQKPEALKGEIVTDKGEYCPYISPDGTFMLYEIVDGPGGFGAGDIYISKKQSDGTWSKGVNLGKEFNSEKHDCYPILTPDGKYLIYMSCRKPDFREGKDYSSFNELLWDVAIPNDEPFDFYWIKATALDKFLK